MKFSAAERRGALIILGILVLIGAWQVRRYYLAQAEAPRGPEDAVVDTPTTLIELNGADTTTLMQVQGIGPTFARRIVRYRALVGGFRSVEDLLKVYGMTPENFARIEPQVRVDTTGPAFAALKAARPKQGQQGYARNYPNNRYPNAWPEKGSQTALAGSVPPTPDSASRYVPATARAPRIVNLNTADSAALVRVPGIGPGTVGRILKYRERLLFYKNLDQLTEVWGLRPENLDKMRPHLSVGENFDAYPRIYLNKWDVEHLGRHPYIGFKDAKILVAYREQHGPFANLDALRWVQGIDSRLPGRLEGYVIF
jgi:competence ComEA-like helix-hairpin-helix protein